MEKVNIFQKGNQRKVDPNWFTNKVHMKDISTSIKSKGQDIYHVHFQNGAKTKLHLHNGSQILLVTKGVGSFEVFKKIGKNKKQFQISRTKKINLKVGDIVYIPPKILHTHGAIAKKKPFSHIAINNVPSKNIPFKTIWYESDFRKSVSKVI